MSQESVKHEPKIQDTNTSSATGGGPEVMEELSKVATSPKRNLLVFGSMAIGFGVMAYNLIAPQLLSGSGKKGDSEQVASPETVVKPAAAGVDTAPPIPTLPEPPKLIAPTPPPEEKIPALPNLPVETAAPSMPPPPGLSGPAAPGASSDLAPPTGLLGLSSDDEKKRLETKRKAPIQLMGGKDPGSGKQSIAEAQQSADFKKRGDLNYVLGQGKIIDVITETAINSDMPGEVRAVVTRDVFSESGKIILIPKGTRVFGAFSTSVTGGYGRVSIKWTRIDLDTGYTVNLVGDAVDNLGRVGVQGSVDNKYTEQMTNALLTSAFSIGVAAGLDKIVPPVQSTQSSANAAVANNLQNSALAIFNDASITDESTKINKICSTTQAMIPDKSSGAFTSLVQACTTAIGSVSSQPGQRLTSVMSSVTAAATSLVTSTSAATVPSQKQDAAQQSFKDLSATMQNMIKQQPITPTTTVDQGHQIKIYVSKDYLFPKDAVIKSKVLK